MTELQQELLGVLAGAIGCVPAECAPAKCWCRQQAAAVDKMFRLLPKRTSSAEGERFWTEERKAELTRLFDAKATQKVMARSMSLSEWQIKHALSKFNMRRRDWGPGKPRPRPDQSTPL